MDTVTFLRESNAIEQVYDDKSLRQAVEAWDYIIEQDTLTIDNILETHRILMKGHLKGKELGNFRERPVWIGGRQGKSPAGIHYFIEKWLLRMNHVEKDKDLEEQIKENHVEYEVIHPFIDGNGRTGRIFMNWQRIKLGLPIMIIEEKKKYLYYKWFPQ